jgi:hypothetical protein
MGLWVSLLHKALGVRDQGAAQALASRRRGDAEVLEFGRIVEGEFRRARHEWPLEYDEKVDVAPSLSIECAGGVVTSSGDMGGHESSIFGGASSDLHLRPMLVVPTHDASVIRRRQRAQLRVRQTRREGDRPSEQSSCPI